METTIYNSVSAIESTVWNTLDCKHNIYFCPEFLDAFEVSNPNIDFKYIVVKDKGIPVALATIQTISLGVDVILKNIKLKAWLKRRIHAMFCRDHINIMFCGNIFLSGEHGIFIAKDIEKKQVADAISKAIKRLAKQTKPLHAIFIKDFVDTSRKWTDQFEQSGFTAMHVEPNMIIHLDEKWTTFEDYKKALKSKYRVKVNKADSKSAALEAKLFCEEDFAIHKDELQQLYENTIANANFNAQVLNLNTYIKLRAIYKEDFIVKAYFLEGELVGFLTALANNNHLDAHFIGLNYDLNKAHAIYPRILNDYIRIGIEKQVSHINFGRTASEIKTTVGAVPTELTCYIKHKRPLVNHMIRPFIKRITLKDFKQHKPFKN